MKPINTVKIFFYLAVLLFVAKPFIGFSLNTADYQIKEPNNILVKIFSKRKPEDLEDARITAASIHQRLTNPPILVTIMALLGFLFPAAYKHLTGVNNSLLNNMNAALVPVHQPYFLSGKLTI
jgi:hypothetical protein